MPQTPTSTNHSTLASILGYLPAILAGLTAAFAINREVGHETAAKVVNDSIAAAAAVTGLIPNEHVQALSQVVSAIAPVVGQMVNTVSPPAPQV